MKEIHLKFVIAKCELSLTPNVCRYSMLIYTDQKEEMSENVPQCKQLLREKGDMNSFPLTKIPLN